MSSNIEELNKEIREMKRKLDHAEMEANAEAKYADEMKAERDAAWKLLKDARNALDFFKNWGESLNKIIGYDATEKSWKPTLDTIARIDEALK